MGLVYAQGGGLGDANGGITTRQQFDADGAIYTGQRPCMVWFRGDLYIIGYYSRPVVRAAGDGAWRIAGIRPPQRPLVVAVGADAGGSEGLCLAYITFLHKDGLKVLAESDPSNVVNVGELGGAGRAWSQIDNVSGESRVTHVRGYASIDGAGYRMAWEAPYGITSFTENVRTARLTFGGPNYDHGIPPQTRYGHSWSGRMWYANSTAHPYRVWFSLPGFPQYVKPAAFRDTLDREPITAIWKGRNELLVFCERATYMIRQFGTGIDDFILEKLDSDVGCISHFGIAEIHNKLWFPGEDGFWIYDGGFRFVSKDILPLWATDYAANRAAFKNGFAMHDRVNKCYLYVTRRSRATEFENTGLYPGTVRYTGYYGMFEPSMGGQQTQPEWGLDMLSRYESSGFYNAEGELVVGSCDGIVRKQDWTNGNDDGDALAKPTIIRTGHHLFFEPGGDEDDGKKIHQLWVHAQSEETPWRVAIKAGDEDAWRGPAPDNVRWPWKADVEASEQLETRALRGTDGASGVYDLRYAPKTVHGFLPDSVAGRGFTFEITALSAVNLQYRGLGGLWGPGVAGRLIQDATAFGLILLWRPAGGSEFVDFPLVGPVGDYEIQVIPRYRYGTEAYPIAVTLDFAPAPPGPPIEIAGPDGVIVTRTLGAETSIDATALDANAVPSTPLPVALSISLTP
jgi:hypothetical protein